MELNRAEHTGAGSDDRVPDWLRAWATRPGAGVVLRQVRDKLERGHRGDRVRVGADLDSAARADLGRLLGGVWEASGSPVTLGRLATALSEHGVELTQLLVEVGGPLRDLPAERATRTARARAQIEQTIQLLTGAGYHPEAVEVALRRRWVTRDPEQVEVARTLARLRELVTQDPVRRMLPEVATRLCGDPHALDRDRALGRSAVRLLAADAAARRDDAAAVAALVDPLSAARTWRATWEDAGVGVDRVSSTVLTVNVLLSGTGPAAALTTAAQGEPVWLTARALDASWDVDPDQVPVVRVCENPSVAETAADAHGERCAPLVCTSGRPSVAAWRLLSGLAHAGVQLLVSADRDPAGVQISDLLTGLPGATAWRPELVGIYEEDRMEGLVDDLGRR